MGNATRMGIWEIYETTPFCIVGIPPLRKIRLRGEGYIKLYRVIKKSLCTSWLQHNHQVHRNFLITLYIKEMKCETATEDRVQGLALVYTVPQSQAISWPAESLSRFGQCGHTNAMLCDVWTAFLSTRSSRASRKLWSSCRGNGFHCTMKTDDIRCQQTCWLAEFAWVLYWSSQWKMWNEFYSGPIHPYVTEAQFPLLQLSNRCLSTPNIGILTQICKKRKYLFFAWGMVAFLVSTTVCKGKGHTIKCLCNHRGRTISPIHSQLGIRRTRVVSTMLRPLYPWERSGTHYTEGWVGLGVGPEDTEKARLHRVSIPVPSSPYQLSYPNTICSS